MSDDEEVGEITQIQTENILTCSPLTSYRGGKYEEVDRVEDGEKEAAVAELVNTEEGRREAAVLDPED